MKDFHECGQTIGSPPNTCPSSCDGQCRHIPLTVLLSPEDFEATVRRRCAAERNSDPPIGILTISLDRYESLEGVFTPDVWDQAFEQLARIILLELDANGCATVAAPQVFAILTGPDEREAEALLSRIRARLACCNESGALPVLLSVKAGFAACHGISCQDLVAMAERVMDSDGAAESVASAGQATMRIIEPTSVRSVGDDHVPVVLLVEDDLSISTFMHACLSDTAVHVLSAGTVAEALRQVREQRVDVIVADINLPDGTGLDILAGARHADQAVAVILTTGLHDLELAVWALRTGADDYLMKPFKAAELRESITRAVAKRRLALGGRAKQASLEAQVRRRTEELRQVIRHLEATYRATLKALGAALDTRDVETHAHSERVAQYALTLGRVLRLSPTQLVTLERGVYLHDIGKIGIPDRVLFKQGSLTEEEWAIMRTHSELGHRLASRVDFLKGASQIILSHHERYDGTGYPSGLKGTEIPAGARIFSVVDALDAITSDRPYRKARSFDVAREEIRTGAGRQFDPEVVEAFLSVPIATWSDIREAVNRQAAEAPETLVVSREALLANRMIP